MIGLRVVLLLMGQTCHEGAVLFLSGSVIAIVLIGMPNFSSCARVEESGCSKTRPPSHEGGVCGLESIFFPASFTFFFIPVPTQGPEGLSQVGEREIGRE